MATESPKWVLLKLDYVSFPKGASLNRFLFVSSNRFETTT